MCCGEIVTLALRLSFCGYALGKEPSSRPLGLLAAGYPPEPVEKTACFSTRCAGQPGVFDWLRCWSEDWL
jgi:hypothetical protein